MNFLIVLLLLATTASILRFYRGPDWPDKIMVFDILSHVLIAGAILFAVTTNNKEALGFVVVVAMLTFVSTAVLVFFLERTRKE